MICKVFSFSEPMKNAFGSRSYECDSCPIRPGPNRPNGRNRSVLIPQNPAQPVSG